jgi:hypothetical protein
MKRTLFALIALVTLIAFTAPALYADDDPAPTPSEPSTSSPGDPPPAPTPES